MEVIEPLRLLFKDEVRALGNELGLPVTSVMRHPFPGPGLGIRIIGEVTKESAETLSLADDIYIEELRKTGHYDKIGQAFAVLLPTVRSVGVMGDHRTQPQFCHTLRTCYDFNMSLIYCITYYIISLLLVVK